MESSTLPCHTVTPSPSPTWYIKAELGAGLHHPVHSCLLCLQITDRRQIQAHLALAQNAPGMSLLLSRDPKWRCPLRVAVQHGAQRPAHQSHFPSTEGRGVAGVSANAFNARETQETPGIGMGQGATPSDSCPHTLGQAADRACWSRAGAILRVRAPGTGSVGQQPWLNIPSGRKRVLSQGTSRQQMRI